MGSIQNYITSCNGKCADADVSNNGWTKLSGDGLDLSQSISDDLRNTMTNKPEKYYTEGAGLWAMAKFVADGSKWDVQIPAGLKAGEAALITAASSSVGIASIQTANAVGATSIAVTRTSARTQSPGRTGAMKRRLWPR